jgi:hypothetical protein
MRAAGNGLGRHTLTFLRPCMRSMGCGRDFLTVGVKRGTGSIGSSMRNPAHMQFSPSGACGDPHIFHAHAGWPGGRPNLQPHEVLLSSCKTCTVLGASSPNKM